MGKKLTVSDVQRREFEAAVKKQLIMAAEKMVIDEPGLLKRIMRAYNIAEMKAALWEEQRGE